MASEQQTKDEVDLETLVQNAAGDSATVEKITGDERYYPDSTKIFKWPHRLEGETLQYIVLMTTGTNHERRPYSGNVEHTKSGRSSLVLTDRALYHNCKGTVDEHPYELIERTLGFFDDKKPLISVHHNATEFEFEIAKSADTENVKKAYAYLRKQVHDQ